MKIVVLDGYTLNPGDLSWKPLEDLGELIVYDRSSDDEVLERAQGCDAIITNKATVSAETIRSVASLKYIGISATGVNVVDTDAATERGIPVCNLVGYGPESVAQMAFAHILNISNRVGEHAMDTRSGAWSTKPDFSYSLYPLVELKGLTLGIIGLGQIGSAAARIGQGFGMKIIASTRDPSREPPQGVVWKTLDTLLAESDFVSLHCPLTPETENFINTESLKLMKPTAILINTSRGQLVDEAALADALNKGSIAGAGLDVLSTEPPSPDNPLLSAHNCWVTPHNAWASRAARSRMLEMTVDNLKNFLAGKVTNCVNL
jgi:glycerate dehydrogenase